MVDSNEITPQTVWRLKPWWCQPWSILSTGIGLITASWGVFHNGWLTGLISLPLGIWMGYFVLIWPQLMADYLNSPDEEIQPPDSPSKRPE
jgi:hypothetical protein